MASFILNPGDFLFWSSLDFEEDDVTTTAK